MRTFIHGLLLSLLFSSAYAQTWQGTPETYRTLLPKLAPGDVLQLAPGEYRNGLPLHKIQGTAQQAIIIRGQDANNRPIFWARENTNTISLLDSSHITIQDLILEGASAPYVDAVKAEGHARWTHHITLERLLIRNHNASQQTVGISTKCTSWNWIIRNNEIIGAGTGMYLGNSDGTDAFIDGLIENNLVINSIGYNLQIKHQKGRETEQASRGTIIRHNIFSKHQGASMEQGLARPNVLVGHFPKTGAGSNDFYYIYGNFFYDNPSEALFQGEGNIALYNNVFFNPHGSAVHIQPHNDVPRNIAIFANTIIAADNGIALRGLTADTQLHANAIFARRNQFAHIKNETNLGAPAPILQHPEKKLGNLAGKFPLQAFAQYPDWDKDYRKRPRHGAFRGALESDEDNWLPMMHF